MKREIKEYLTEIGTRGGLVKSKRKAMASKRNGFKPGHKLSHKGARG